MLPASPSAHTPAGRRRRIFLVGISSLLAGAAAFLLASSWFLNAWLRSESFRLFINKKTSDFFQADGQYLPVQWSGFSFYSDGYEARGRDGAPLSKIRADQIRAEFYPAGVFHRAWQINALDIGRLDIELAGGVPRGAALHAAKTETPRNSWMPGQLDIRRTDVRETELRWSPPGHPGSLMGARCVLEADGKALVARVTGGQLQQAGWPVLRIDHLGARYLYPDLFITDGLLKFRESENLEVSGHLSFAGAQPVDLQIKAGGVAVTPFLPKDWRARLHGSMFGDVRARGNLAAPSSLDLSGTMRLAGGQLEALPVLDEIARFTRSEQFRTLRLHKAGAEFHSANGRLSVSRLAVESEGLLRIEGDFTVEHGVLDGRLQAGVTAASLRWLPGSAEHVFITERDGFLWAPVHVYGPLTDIREDLSPRLVKAAERHVIDSVGTTLEKGVREVIDFVTPLSR